MKYFAITDPGRVRELNEDAWNHARLSGGYDLIIVSDGVGGHAAGEIASRIVAQTLPVLIDARLASQPEPHALPSELYQSLVILCNTVREQSLENPAFRDMAATVVCGLIRDDLLVLGNMGDSRCYFLRDGTLQQHTTDHSLVQMLLDLGEIRPDQALRHPSAGKLTQAVGMAQEPLPQVITVDIQKGDRLLFCTDGLHGMVGNHMITEILCAATCPETACSGLVRAALDAGGKDNITVVIADINSMGKTDD